jgi:hypothetical protein
MSDPRKVIIESPYRGHGYATLDLNLAYARACMHDCLVNRDEPPFASHLLYTQPGVLDDQIPEEREKGIKAGLEWGKAADLSAVYLDLIDDWKFFVGIARGVKVARALGRPVDFRNLPKRYWRD